ncbi:hypothetical protein JM946_05515 [Steroidobacter sp. S1-65]|uniref:Uncharacterized protein n=1 Tax=Steroidobacter gossypii TaxID=2805490 RepID=A0ABS1WT81_9GAMM|nr:hypothetical protein [Steroidobacter gossypii]MBM0104191.1 hypothetical protein [Steroidobacter gossypii]
MGVSLSYSCSAPIPQQDRARLLEAVDQAVDSFTWWAEPICLWEHEGSVAGDTKIFLLAYSTNAGETREVEPEDDTIMAWRDTVRILELLQDYARTYRLVWNIDLAGEPFGQIRGDNEQDAVTFANAAKMLEAITGFGPTHPELPQRIAEIDAKFSDRWES